MEETFPSINNQQGKKIEIDRTIVCIFLFSPKTAIINQITAVSNKIPQIQFLVITDGKGENIANQFSRELPRNFFFASESDGQNSKLIGNIDLLVFWKYNQEKTNCEQKLIASDKPKIYFNYQEILTDSHSHVVFDRPNPELLLLIIERFFMSNDDSIRLNNNYLNITDAANSSSDLSTITLQATMIDKQAQANLDYAAQGFKLQRKGKLEDAIHRYNKALHLDYQQPLWVFSNYLSCLEAQGHFEPGIEIAKKAIEIHGEIADLYRWLGLFCDRCDQISEVIINYSKAIALNSEQPSWVYLVLSNHYLTQEKTQDSIKVALEGAKRYSDIASFHRILGINYDKKGDRSKVIEHYLRAIDLDFQQPFWVYSVLIQYFGYENNFGEATDIALKAIELYPKKNDLYYHLGVVQKKQDKLDAAISSIQNSIVLNPKHFWSYLTLGKIYLEQYEWEQASNLLTKAVELDPKSFEAFVCLGDALAWQGLVDEASKCYYNSVKLGLFNQGDF